jgi:hypothetical protein
MFLHNHYQRLSRKILYAELLLEPSLDQSSLNIKVEEQEKEEEKEGQHLWLLEPR